MNPIAARHNFSCHSMPVPDAHAISLEKKHWRGLMRQQRGGLHKDEVKQASLRWVNNLLELLATKHLMKLGGVTGPAIIALYMPIKNEIDVMLAVSPLQQQGFSLALPRMRGEGQPLDFCHYFPGRQESRDDQERLVTAAHGITQPGAEAVPLIPDIIILPLLAFDAQGYRLGWGKGYYDRTLAHPLYHHCLLLGAGYGWQQIPHVPHDEWDIPLNHVITG